MLTFVLCLASFYLGALLASLVHGGRGPNVDHKWEPVFHEGKVVTACLRCGAMWSKDRAEDRCTS